MMMKKGFTLMELLVVMSIIALIVGILIPVVGKAQQSAWRARTRDELSQVVQAWEAYLMEYRKFPNTAISQMDITANRILSGTESNAFYNTSKIVFLEFTTNQMAVGYIDHWGGMVQVCLDNGLGGDDAAYNGQVLYNGDVVKKSAIAWSKGQANGEPGNPPNAAGDDIKGWKTF